MTAIHELWCPCTHAHTQQREGEGEEKRQRDGERGKGEGVKKREREGISNLRARNEEREEEASTIFSLHPKALQHTQPLIRQCPGEKSTSKAIERRKEPRGQ